MHWTELPSHHDMSPYAEFYQRMVSLARSSSYNGQVRIVELGVRHGCSARILQSAMTKAHDALFLVDPNHDQLVNELLQDERVQFINWTAESAANVFDFGEIDLLHIDVDPHEREQTSRIFWLYEKRIRRGGGVILHDCTPKFGVFDFVKSELETSPNWTLLWATVSDVSPDSAPVCVIKK